MSNKNAALLGNPAWLKSEITRVRQEISIANGKIASQQNTVNTRKQYLTRLEAQLVFASGSGQVSTMSV